MFAEKFRLLNSPEHSDSEDINWSSSSEYENSSYHKSISDKTLHRKRKRRKEPKTNSSLDFTIANTSKIITNNSIKVKSPILVSKSARPKSPILNTSSRNISRNKRFKTSPILIKKNLSSKSPILMLKYSSPKSSEKVCKRLFNENNEKDNIGGRYCDIMCPKNVNYKLFDITSSSADTETNKSKSFNDIIQSQSFSAEDSDSSSKAKLVNRVMKFFDGNFSSDSRTDYMSQIISNTPTPENSSKSEDIEILSCGTQFISNNMLTEQDSTADTTVHNITSKKVGYKKGGLAYKLDVLLKKHNAHTLLWQHEQFLASNSNFVIPKGQHRVFYIQKSFFKYDCYLLEAMSMNDEKYYILINSLYVTKNLYDNCILKLYEPYLILDNMYQSCKLIINVSKFEIVD